MTEELFGPFMFRYHEVGRRGVGWNSLVLCLKRCVKAVKGDADVGCLVVGIGSYDAFGISVLWEFYGLEKVAKELA